MLCVTKSTFQAGDLHKACKLQLRAISVGLMTWERLLGSRNPPNAEGAWRNLTKACYNGDATTHPVVPLDTARQGC